MFISQRPNLDPTPWENMGGHRVGPKAAAVMHLPIPGWTKNPRPEFEPTRDPEPWRSKNHVIRYTQAQHDSMLYSEVLRWAPRREQFDTPVNPILVAFRADDSFAQTWLDDLDLGSGDAFWCLPTPTEIDHARKVLTRLAAL